MKMGALRISLLIKKNQFDWETTPYELMQLSDPLPFDRQNLEQFRDYVHNYAPWKPDPNIKEDHPISYFAIRWTDPELLAEDQNNAEQVLPELLELLQKWMARNTNPSFRSYNF